MTELRGSACRSAISDAEEASAADQILKLPRPVLSSLCGGDLEPPKSKRPTGKWGGGGVTVTLNHCMGTRRHLAIPKGFRTEKQ